jgi:hypothetical protein
MTGFLSGLTSVLALALIHFVARRIRSSQAERRRQKRMNGGTIDVPARLRGRAPAHPRFWRAGTFEPTTATWRPRGPWGMPVSLAGARVHDLRRGSRKNGMPPVAWDDLLITAHDRDGFVFQVAALDEAEASMVARSLDTATPAPDRDTGPVRLRWLRNRVPLAALALLVLTILTVGYLTVPLIGQAEVDAVVVSNRGPEYLCEVAWVDPPAHRTSHGYVDRRDRQEGDHMLTPRPSQVIEPMD